MAKIDEANASKSGKFSGEHFRRWQTQVRYWLTVLGIFSTIDNSQSSPDQTSSWMTEKQIEYHCYHRILRVLSDHLYEIYLNDTITTKGLWETLEAKYGIDDVGINRFTVSTFNNYKISNE